jgi:hypothetical protein
MLFQSHFQKIDFFRDVRIFLTENARELFSTDFSREKEKQQVQLELVHLQKWLAFLDQNVRFFLKKLICEGSLCYTIFSVWAVAWLVIFLLLFTNS